MSRAAAAVPLLFQQQRTHHSFAPFRPEEELRAWGNLLGAQQPPLQTMNNNNNNSSSSSHPKAARHGAETESDSCSSSSGSSTSNSNSSSSSILRHGSCPPLPHLPSSSSSSSFCSTVSSSSLPPPPLQLQPPGDGDRRVVRFVEPDHREVASQNAKLDLFEQNQQQHRLNARVLQAAPFLRASLAGVSLLSLSSLWVLACTWSDLSPEAVLLRRMLLSFLALKVLAAPVLLFPRQSWRWYLQRRRRTRQAVKNLASTVLYLWCGSFVVATALRLVQWAVLVYLDPAAASLRPQPPFAASQPLLWYCVTIASGCLLYLVLEALAGTWLVQRLMDALRSLILQQRLLHQKEQQQQQQQQKQLLVHSPGAQPMAPPAQQRSSSTRNLSMTLRRWEGVHPAADTLGLCAV